MTPAVESRLSALEQYVEKACSRDVPSDVSGDLFKFGAVLVCGTIERCVELIVLDRLSNKAHPKIINFVKSHFKRGTNYDCEAIGQLLVRFDADWADEFRSFVQSNEAVREGISSCYAIRNLVAHGGPGSLGSARLKELAVYARQTIEALVTATAH